MVADAAPLSSSPCNDPLRPFSLPRSARSLGAHAHTSEFYREAGKQAGPQG